METDVQKFYKNKRIFITGATGFLGKVLIEKLLSSTDVACIYTLVRPKRGVAAKDRLSKLFENTLFDNLNKLKPNAIDYIKPIYGDCREKNLGLSDEDTMTIIENVDVIFHCAATVRFNEPLNVAIDINIRATMDMLKLARRIHNLEIFLYVSTAFSYCPFSHIEEEFYAHRLNFNADQMCKLEDVLGAEKLNSMTLSLIEEFPNTYTFTKALAEESLLSLGEGLPICVFRPGIIAASCESPMPGWIDNLYGPTSILFGAARGVLRVILLGTSITAPLVPVDYCVNLMLVSAWKVAKNQNQELPSQPPVYNFVPEMKNSIKWRNYTDTIETYRYQLPLKNMLWYPFAFCTKSITIYKILWFIYHTIPGYLTDFILTLNGKKPRMIELYKKINVQMNLLHYFAIHRITFTTIETRKLWAVLSPEDQKIFNFDMETINWQKYLFDSLGGMRLFLGNEKPDTIPIAKRKMMILQTIHYGLLTTFLVLIGFLLFRIFL